MPRCAVCDIAYPISLYIWLDKKNNKYYNLGSSGFSKEVICDYCGKAQKFERIHDMTCTGCGSSFVLKVGHLFIDNHTAACWICMSKFRAWQSNKKLTETSKENS